MCFFAPISKRLSSWSVYFAAFIVLSTALPLSAQPIQTSQEAPTTRVTEDARGSGQSLGLSLGYYDDHQSIGVVYGTPTWWRHHFENGWGYLDLNAEIGVTYWDAKRGQPDSLWQLAATPMLRWWPNEFFYTEIGVGASVLSRTSFADRNLSSAFQFGNHIGVGVLIKQSHQLGLRFSHFSNGGIKDPNDGLDVLQLTYTYRY